METNMNKIIHLTYWSKQGVPRDKYIYLIDELEDGQNRIVDIAGKDIHLVIPDENTSCLLTVAPDEEVTLGKFLTYVEDVFTEEQLLERQEKQNNYYDLLGAKTPEISNDTVNNGSYVLSKSN